MPGMPNVTANGYSVWEVISAMQKAVRRGQEERAMFWALELVDTNMIYHALSRLEVIAQEDVGMADMQAVLFAQNSINKAREFWKAKKQSWKLALANAVLSLCRAEKTRISDHFQCVIRGRRKRGLKIEIPDEALDKHTRRGKKKGRDAEHFVNEACMLFKGQKDKYQDEAAKYWIQDDREPNENQSTPDNTNSLFQ